MLGPLKNVNRIHFLVAIPVLLAAAGAFQWAEAQPAFCNVCHEMGFHYSSWQNSTHAGLANCLDCHATPGVGGFIDEKIRGLRELFVHFTGGYNATIDTGSRVQNSACISCHPTLDKNGVDEVRHDIHQAKGVMCTDCHTDVVHSSPGEPTVMPQSKCESCHNKHKAFPMTGKHASLPCAACHEEGVYNKAPSSSCESCHTTPTGHIDGISSNCDACHTLEGWKPAATTHSELSLTGGHYGQACRSCHASPDGNYTFASSTCESCHSKPALHFETAESCNKCHTAADWTQASFDHSFFQLTGAHLDAECIQCHTGGSYEGTPTACESCHFPEEHVYGISSRCEACHTTSSWDQPTASHTALPLTGSHKGLTCDKCHKQNTYQGLSNRCSACHEPPMEHLKTTEGCNTCHIDSGWRPARFDHSFYLLTGGHFSVNCTSCHPGGRYEVTQPLCESCHSPPADHVVGDVGTCELCHTNEGWKPAVYDHTGFPLTQSHASASCLSCHKGGVFVGTPTSCANCHNPPTTHVGMSNNCASCHTKWSWSPSTFTHSGSLLSGSHTGLTCGQCHTGGSYANQSSSCASCHTAPQDHPIPNPGNCASCHTTNSFSSATLSHTTFPLTGSHTSLACTSCHSGGTYVSLGTSCSSCHTPPSTHVGLSTVCTLCHSTTAFVPTLFTHPKEGPHIPAGDRPLPCTSCHQTTYAVATCASCHSRTPGG